MSKTDTKVAFIDRDGVINKEINYLHRIEDFQYTENCIKALLQLRNLGYELVVITNQAGIAKGLYSESDYQALTSWYLEDLAKHGIDILAVLHCPHHPEGSIPELSIECNCRKPKAGMLIEAQQSFNIDMDHSILIGDKVSDIQAGINAGIHAKNCYLVETGHPIARNGSTLQIFPTMIEVIKHLNSLHNRM